ncbi:MAG: ATP-binding protein [Candidatus Firestonebacteria bacterium]
MVNKENIKLIIKESQEFEFPYIIERSMKIPSDTQKIVTVTGPRRSGKTYLFYNKMKELVGKGISREKMFCINFDDPKLLPFDGSDIDLIIESYRDLYPSFKNEKCYAFFDEVQNAKNWGKGIRRLLDTGSFRIFLTGSSSKVFKDSLSREIRGRSINFNLLPFSFKEIVRARGISFDRNTSYSKERHDVKNELEFYLEFGGFPEAVLEKNKDLKMRILSEYWNTMFLKDMVERYSLRNEGAARELMRYLTTNISSVFSVTAFWKAFKEAYPMTKRTLIRYVSALENTGLFILNRKYSASLKEQMLSPRKCYLIDNGLRAAYGFRFSEDYGKILENTVMIELKQRQLHDPLLEVYYWKNGKGKEVDFVVKQGTKVKQIIQSCAETYNIETKEREIAPLLKAGKEFKCRNLLIITRDEDREEKRNRQTIKYLPLWKWLLFGE